MHMSVELRFEDDVVIVTGAGRGLGREHALHFAARGAKVVVNDIDDLKSGGSGTSNPAEQVVSEIRALGGQAVADNNSVATAEGADALVKLALKAFGNVTVLVNNAGIIRFESLADTTDESWRKMLAVTLDGTFFMSRAVWPVFKRNHYGRVVNTTSNAGFAGQEMLAHYGAAKLGVAGLTKCLAREATAEGITVNAIAPMAVTRMNKDFFFGGSEPDPRRWIDDIRSGRVPMGPPSAISSTVLWLAHRDTTINGEIFSTSSGKVARVAFIVGEGYFKPDHSPEDLRDHASQIRALGSFLDPTCTMDELAAIPPLFAT
jgi:NAD(P)-dependent dehydrogenase (short-subunit alcohol dehydrogenase family)